MDKDNKKKKVTDFDKVLDSFCTDQADLVRATKVMHDMFESLVEGGFTEQQAMTFLVSTVMGLLGGAR